MTCPICGKENEDNWPVNIDDKVEFGACQECFEKEADESWWDQVMAISQIMLGDEA